MFGLLRKKQDPEAAPLIDNEVVVHHHPKNESVHFAAAENEDQVPKPKKTKKEKKATEKDKDVLGLPQPKVGPTESRTTGGHSRTINLVVSRAELVHDEAPNADLAPEDDDMGESSALPTSIIVTGALHIVLGVSSLACSLALHLAGTLVQIYLEVCGSHTYIPAMIIFISEGLTIALGIAMIAALLLELHAFFYTYPHILWLILVLDLAAICYSVAGWRDVNMSAYERIFESEVFNYCPENDINDYRNVLKDDYRRNFWHDLERNMKCCGIDGGKDWLTLCGRIPSSCCDGHHRDCRRNLTAWNNKAANLKNLTEVIHLLHVKSCRRVLSIERSSLRRDWVIYPVAIGFFDILLMVAGNHHMHLIVRKFRIPKGRREVTSYRQRCCRRNRASVAPYVSESKAYQDVLDEADDRPTLPDEFVTDRKSLLGLVRSMDEDAQLRKTSLEKKNS